MGAQLKQERIKTDKMQFQNTNILKEIQKIDQEKYSMCKRPNDCLSNNGKPCQQMIEL